MRSRCVGLITEDPALYADLAPALRERGIPSVSLWPGERIPERIAVVLTSPREAGLIAHPRVVAVAPEVDRSTLWAVVENAMASRDAPLRGDLIIGVDPGPRPGYAVIQSGRVLVAGVLESPESVGPWAEALARQFPGHRLTFRVGSGDPPDRNRILEVLAAHACIFELVDERRTTPRGNRRGRDAAAARAIARLPGRAVGRLPKVRPTRGALTDIQRLSREGSGGRFTISREVARQVLVGDLTLRQAIDAGSVRYAAGASPGPRNPRRRPEEGL
ncbi:MAG TPA: hypothetical protein VMH90_01640 [Thermoplasmata archaeon]|nr:hypothetical protein [Thermoplasmata archaeon]